MEFIWHPLINVGLVLGSIFVAGYSFHIDRPVKDLIIYLAIGIAAFYFAIAPGLENGLCVRETNFIDQLIALDNCIEPFSLEALLGQFAILISFIIILGLCWRPLWRKIEEDERRDGT